MSRFSKVLVANRGEIAVRVIRGVQKQGYRAVAVYSEADRNALHVRIADEAVCLGPAPAADSYLAIDKLIAAAQSAGAEAVHPGYGFLSERADFSKAVQDAGLIFIGPDASSIETMGNKSASKRLMIDAGVPCVPGYQGDDQADETLQAEAKKIGLPVMIKAAAGGGGRGMRLVTEASALLENIRSARSEASNAFGDGQLLVEKAIVHGRHVEIQVFGDRHGNVIHLGERDCSIQRRNQKVVEESPSPAVDEALRLKMGAAAVAAAKAVDYVGAGTVEFMLGQDGAFYFLEMNTRLQVEHPVTELVYGVDLVDWQLRVAQGETLPMTQDQVLARRHGHAIEVRLCAEDPTNNYLPQTGCALRWRAPQGEGVRVDTYLEDGALISPYYDSMQGKIIAWGEDRETARSRLLHALEETLLLGVTSNRDYLHAVLSTEAFASGDFSTGFVGRYFPQAQLAEEKPTPRHRLLAAVALYLDDARQLAEVHGLREEMIGWHSSHPVPVTIRLKQADETLIVPLSTTDGCHFEATIDEQSMALDIIGPVAGERFCYAVDGVQAVAAYVRDGDTLWLDADNAIYHYRDVTQAASETAAAGSDGRMLARSDGKIVGVHIAAGDRVEKGQTLAVLEAMKMEFQLTAPVPGQVAIVNVEAGQQVKARQLLIEIEAGETVDS